MSKNGPDYERKITSLERMLSWSPYSMVTLVARVNGEISEEMLNVAVIKAQQRHPLLRIRIQADDQHLLWFTSKNVKAIPVKVVPRTSDSQWQSIVDQENLVPFDFPERPPIRFFLLQSHGISDIIIFCHHIICDGLSLAFLARDVLSYLGDPAKNLVPIPDPVYITPAAIPEEISLNKVVKFALQKINQKWGQNPFFATYQDYLALHAAYWKSFSHKTSCIELSESQTTSLVERCRHEQVTVNSTLTAAFVGAQCHVLGNRPFLSHTGVAGSLRDRLRTPAGEAMGFYADLVTFKASYDLSKPFWHNARAFHAKLQPLYSNQHIFKDALQFSHLDPAIMESRHFKVVGHLVDPSSPSYEKLYAFSQRQDILSKLLKKSNIDSARKIFLGTAVTNLTRLEFPTKFGDLTLDRIILHPGRGFPLSNVHLVVGAVTCAGKISLILEHEAGTLSPAHLAKIQETALSLLQV